MNSLSQEVISNPVLSLLLAAVFVVALWIGHFAKSIRKENNRFNQGIAIPYILYSISIMTWIASNAYFHSPLLTNFGEEMAITLAIIANISSYSAFAFAFLVSLKLTRHLNSSIYELFSHVTLILFTGYVLYSNLMPGLTISGITIIDKGSFILDFGPATSSFFLTVLILIILTFRNLIIYSKSSISIHQVRSIYMIVGISVFMFSTLLIHVIVPFLWNDFSLAWLPPALSITEMLLMGYALITARFYSSRHILYTALKTVITCGLIIIPLFTLIQLFSKSDQIGTIAISCIATAITWKWVYSRVKPMASRVVYGTTSTPQEQIYALADTFQKSTTQAMHKLATILNISDYDLQTISSDQEEQLYRSQFRKKGNILVFEELLLGSETGSEGLMPEHLKKMHHNNVALVLPIFDHADRLSHLLLANRKRDGKLFFSEEIQALQSVFVKAQGYINADRKVRQSQALANSIAHEMRNPLAQVQLQFEMLSHRIERGDSPELLLSEVRKGNAAISRGRQLIDIILREVSDSSLESEPSTPMSMKRAIEQAVERYAFENSSSRARVHLNTQQDFVARVNDTLFNFVIFNLLRNALYYFDSYPDSQIEISTHKSKFENYVLFTDTGPGIPSEFQHRIFDDFFSHNKSGGSGLGLGYCRRVMQSFGGKIECESVEGEKTTFKLIFPAQDLPLNKELVSSSFFFTPEPILSEQLLDDPVALKESTSDITVLVVDDKEVQRSLVIFYLDQLNVNVIQANNGLKAIEQVKANSVDLVLMDIQMPVLNGFDASRAIKQFRPDLPIVALSGESGERELELIDLLMDDRLTKPTTKQALSELLKRYFPEEANSISNNEIAVAH